MVLFGSLDRMATKPKFFDIFETLQDVVSLIEIDGQWTSVGEMKQFRSDGGGVMNYWPTTGTLFFQGKHAPLWRLFYAVRSELGRDQERAKQERCSDRKRSRSMDCGTGEKSN